MPQTNDRCRHCGAAIPEATAVYGDHNRSFCSESCARAQMDSEQGRADRSRAGGDVAADRVGPDGRPAVPRNGPTTR